VLIICSGPDSFRARRKYRELSEAFRVKHDPTSSSIETIEPGEQYQEVLAKLSNPTLFASKKMLRCEYLFNKLTPAQIKKLAAAVERDAEQTVVLDYEDKSPTEKTLGAFPSSLLHTYPYESLIGSALQKEVSQMCKNYGVSEKQSANLIRFYGEDLWSIETELQILRLQGVVGADLEGANIVESNLYATVDEFLENHKGWMNHAESLEINELMNAIISQLRSWQKIQAHDAQDVHPYVQKKLAYKKISNATEELLCAYRALIASRSSLAQQQEAVQLL